MSGRRTASAWASRCEHRSVAALASLAKERAHGGAMEEMRHSVSIAAFWEKAAGVNLKLSPMLESAHLCAR